MKQATWTLIAILSFLLISCPTKPQVAVEPEIITLQNFVTQCATGSQKFSIFFEATLTSGIAAQIDQDLPNQGRPSSESEYRGFFLTNATMETYLSQNKLDKQTWLVSASAKDFVKKHFVKGTSPWTEALTTTPQPPTKFSMTTLAGTTIQVDWQSIDSAILTTSQSQANRIQPSTLNQELNPKPEESWRQFRYLGIMEISNPLL